MPYFSRLTDIITCSLSAILEESDDPTQTLRDVLSEMEEGLSGARRSARTAVTNRDRLTREVADCRVRIDDALASARQALTDNDEQKARQQLSRKVEAENLLEGLLPELEASENTCAHLERIRKALEARFAEARRTLAEMTGDAVPVQLESETAVRAAEAETARTEAAVDEELLALRRELGQGE